MKTNRRKWMRTLMALTLTISLSHVSAATLQIGDEAPKLQVSKWIQGEPVKEFASDKVYLVEFWATWCGPCRVSIPHVNALHQKFQNKGLVVIGQDVQEEKPEAVAPFVKEMGTNMTYRVALDTDDGAMNRTWMEAAGEDGIPVAFVVDKRGLIAWIGHPSELQGSVIEQLLDDSFSIAKAAADYSRRNSVEAQLNKLMGEFNRQVRNEEWDAAETNLTAAGKIWPEEHRERFELTRFGFLLDRRQYQQAYKIASELSDTHPDDAMMQNSITWTMATKNGLVDRNLELAEKIARRAHAVPNLGNAEQAEILDTLARVLFLKGEKKSAIEFQEQAVELATGNRKTQFSKNLSDYKAGRVPNESHLRALHQKVSSSVQKGEWAKAEAALAELEKELPPEQRNGLDYYRFRIFAGRGDYDRAAKIVESLTQSPEKDPMMLNSLAWSIAIRENAAPRELALGETIARRANDATKGENAEILDTLARLVFRKGEKAAAIKLQEQAVTFAKGHRKTQFQETLDGYQAGTLPKTY